MALNVHKGVFTAPVANGNFDYTLPANFDPKWVMVWTSYRTAPGLSLTDAVLVHGFATARGGTVAQWYHGAFKDSGAATDAGIRFQGSDAVLKASETLTTTMTFEMDLVSFTTGSGSKITFNMVDFPNAAIKIHVFALGGSSLLDAQTGSIVMNTTGVAQAITAGFQPTLVMVPGAPWTAPLGAVQDDIRFHLGVATTAEKRAAVFGNNQSAANMTLGTAKYNRLGVFQGASSAALPDGEIDLDIVSNWPATGFQIVYPNALSFGLTAGWTALKFDSTVKYKIGSNSAPLATGSQTIGSLPSGVAKGAIVWGTMDPLSLDVATWTGGAGANAASTRLGGFSFGAYDGTTQGSAGIADTSNSAASVASFGHSETKGISTFSGSATLRSDADLSFSGTDLLANWTTVDTVQAGFNYFIIGEDAASTPISASDAFTFSEASLLAIDVSVTDGAAITEVSAYSASLAAAEAFALSAEIAAKVETLALAASDGETLAEIAAKVETLPLTASDASSLNDVSTIAVTLAAADSATSSEGASAVSATLVTSEGWVLTEISSPAVTLATSDAWIFSESPASVGSLLTLSVTDAGVFSELAASAAIALAAAESHTLSEATASLSNALNAVDAGGLLEAVSIAVTAAAADAGLFAENAAAGRLESITASDAWALAEAAATSLALSLTDSAAQSEGTPSLALSASDVQTTAEALTITAALMASEAGTLTEAATGGEFRDVVASDVAVLSDASDLASVVIKAASDSLTQLDASALNALLSASETGGLSETLSLAASLLATENVAASEVAAVAASLAAYDGATVMDLASLNTAAFVRILSSLASAAATIQSMTSAARTDSNTMASGTAGSGESSPLISADGVATATAGDSEALL